MGKQTITSFYDSREYADKAALMLMQAGVLEHDIMVSPDTASSYADVDDHPAKGFWASLQAMFGGTVDQDTYVEGLRRGGIMVTAHVDDAKVDAAVDILESHGSVDLNQRETAWRNEGWTGGMALDVGTGTANAGMSAMGLVPTGAVGSAPARLSTASSAAATISVAKASPTRQDGMIEVVEETLSVGKRAINRGKVRLHAYVVEKAVSENVTLRDETVSIDRRPVDRPISGADLGATAFADRTVEMDEIDEEAVVAKSARIVEEVGLRREMDDTVRTVSDTVRSTKVEIDDGRTAGSAATGLTSGPALENLEVVGADGVHVGVVDHIDGTMIKLKALDPAAGGQHHLIPMSWVRRTEGTVQLSVSAADARSRWMTV